MSRLHRLDQICRKSSRQLHTAQSKERARDLAGNFDARHSNDTSKAVGCGPSFEM
jgi:hypothetical protein